MPPEKSRGLIDVPLIDVRLIDVHCHVLPGVDDGAVDLDEALAMCRLAAAQGCRTLILTPHLRHAQWSNDDRAGLERRFDELRRRLAGSLEIHLGGEIAVSSACLDEILDLPAGQLLTLAGSRYVLLELDWLGLGPDVFELVHELKVRGLEPVIAHPERLPWLAANPALLEELVLRGAYLQLTAMSLTGELGAQLGKLCEELLEAGLVHFVASDAHDLEFRPPGLRRVFEHVVRRHGSEPARRLFVTHPRAVVDDVPLVAARRLAPAPEGLTP